MTAVVLLLATGVPVATALAALQVKAMTPVSGGYCGIERDPEYLRFVSNLFIVAGVGTCGLFWFPFSFRSSPTSTARPPRLAGFKHNRYWGIDTEQAIILAARMAIMVAVPRASPGAPPARSEAPALPRRCQSERALAAARPRPHAPHVPHHHRRGDRARPHPPRARKECRYVPHVPHAAGADHLRDFRLREGVQVHRLVAVSALVPHGDHLPVAARSGEPALRDVG